MNCQRCNAPLMEDARFCRICGLPVSTSVPNNVVDYPAQADQTLDGPPTVATRWEEEPPESFQPAQPAQWQPPYVQYSAPPVQPTQPSPQPQWGPPPAQPTQLSPQPQWMPQNAQQPLVNSPGNFQGSGVQQPTRRKGRAWRRIVITLLVLVVLVVGGWFLVARPILHGIAESQINQVASSGINQILPFPPFVRTPSIAVTETGLNNLIVLNHAPSDPVQNAVVHITQPIIASDGSNTGGVRFDFQLYGFACSITGIPMASNGDIVMTHVQVQGILWWVMSPDEMTSIFNSRFHDAIGRLQRQVTSVTTKNQEIDIQFN